ncbi:MAG TPA: sigma 54-interacting transcriptional regulator [Candidatus Binataceae bacterium]|nr:sigma 54-interacting transcriptional regulator [Candidatus Binataceae bacterium]
MKKTTVNKVDKKQAQSTSFAPVQSRLGRPAYLGFLWNHDLDELRAVLEGISRYHAPILDHWHDQYRTHLGEGRALSEAEFREIFSKELRETVDLLLRHDLDGFIEHIRREAENLAQRQVPYYEVIISMHLFEESVAKSLPGFPPLPATYLAFDKLSHIRSIVLADTYFRVRASLLSTRIYELENEAGMLPLERREHFHGLVGASPAMRRLYERICRAAVQRQGTVLLVGETGVGKELVARALHEAGPGAHGPFIPFNCAAIPRELVESELFGHKRGAFSGAGEEYLGLFRAAEGGTLFLDEITEMALDTQSKLLRALQERAVRPVGHTRELPINLRLVASTNRQPLEAVTAGRLREDLYYRLQAMVLEVPPLRERMDDLPLLIAHFQELYNQRLDRTPPLAGIAPDALARMRAYHWPGNVRELANAIESAATFAQGPRIELADLPDAVRAASSSSKAVTAKAQVGDLAEAERQAIGRALAATKGNKVQAAMMLGISRKKLYSKLKQYGWF